MRVFGNFRDADDWVRDLLRYRAHRINAGKWQGMNVSGKPEMDHFEVLNLSFSFPMPATVEKAQADIRPHLPWAEDHFQERVSGEPLNPGEQYKNWPFYKHRPENDRFRTENEKFTHSYMERYWPRWANMEKDTSGGGRFGVRYRYGDLNDLVNLLRAEPFTRQAYLPVWFPEDTGVVHGGRVPCTLGYHFILRGGYLHTTYYIRSCDYLRHFKDDVYMTVRLAQWVHERLQDHPVWKEAQLGRLTFHCVSMHMFAADRKALGWDKEV